MWGKNLIDFYCALNYAVTVNKTAAGVHSVFVFHSMWEKKAEGWRIFFYYFLEYLKDMSVGFTEGKLFSFKKPQHFETLRSAGLCHWECQCKC